MANLDIYSVIDECDKILEFSFGKKSYSEALKLVCEITDIPEISARTPGFSFILDKKLYKKVISCARKRADQMPLQYLSSRANFMNEEYFVGEGVLIPRFDTEVLVEKAFNMAGNPTKSLNILEFCTGSGCIVISLCKMFDRAGIKYNALATDISGKALSYAKKNLKTLSPEGDIQFYRHNILGEQIPFTRDSYDIVISNPPYIPSADIDELEVQVSRYEPRIALDGGADGLEFYRRIVGISSFLLSEKGILALEIGYNQEKSVMEIIEKSNSFSYAEVTKDYCNNPRVITAVKERNKYAGKI